jgi:MFS family permease
MPNENDNSSKSPAILRAVSVTGFRYLWFGQICSQVASNSLIFVLALQLYRLTYSNTAVSMMFLIYGLSAMLLGLVAGTVVDKLHNRKVLISCDLLRAAIVLLYIFIPKNIATIYLLTFLNSVITQFYVPAEAPTIPHLVPRHLVVAANSVFSFTYYSSLAAGSVLAGPILRIFGPENVYIALGVLFLIAAFCVSQINDFAKSAGKDILSLLKYAPDYVIHRLIANIKEGIGYVRQSRILSDAMLLLLGTQVTIAILGTLGPGFADKVMGIDVRDSSILIMGPTVLGIILGALTIGNISRRIKSRTLIKTGITAAGIVLILIAVIVRISRINSFNWILPQQTGFIISIILFFLLGVANSMLDIPANSILQQETGGEMRGRVYGILSVGFGSIGMLPVVFSGFLADSIGVGKVILTLGILVTGYGFWRMKYNKT